MKTGFLCQAGCGQHEKEWENLHFPIFLTCIITNAMSHMVISLSRNRVWRRWPEAIP